MVYIPTTEHEDNEVKKTYIELSNLRITVNEENNLIILRDLNTSVNKDRKSYKVGKYRLRK